MEIYLQFKSPSLKAEELAILTLTLLYVHASMTHIALNKVQLEFLCNIFQNLRVN